MWFFNKFNRLKREEVKNAYLQLEEQEESVTNALITKKEEIDRLLEKGKTETDRTMKLFYAKKINALKADREENVQRVMFLLYNKSLMEKLLNAIDDKNFIASVGKVPLNKLMKNQKDLAKFLNKALHNKIKSEDVMTSADEVFVDVKTAYLPNATIYGVNKADDESLAMFETESALDEQGVSATIDASKKVAAADGAK